MSFLSRFSHVVFPTDEDLDGPWRVTEPEEEDAEVLEELDRLRARDAALARLHDKKRRTESSAQAAFVLALVSLVIAPLAIPALILTHWAARGSERTVALVVGWLVAAGMIVCVIAIIVIGAIASDSVNG